MVLTSPSVQEISTKNQTCVQRARSCDSFWNWCNILICHHFTVHVLCKHHLLSTAQPGGGGIWMEYQFVCAPGLHSTSFTKYCTTQGRGTYGLGVTLAHLGCGITWKWECFTDDVFILVVSKFTILKSIHICYILFHIYTICWYWGRDLLFGSKIMWNSFLKIQIVSRIFLVQKISSLPYKQFTGSTVSEKESPFCLGVSKTFFGLKIH